MKSNAIILLEKNSNCNSSPEPHTPSHFHAWEQAQLHTLVRVPQFLLFNWIVPVTRVRFSRIAYGVVDA